MIERKAEYVILDLDGTLFDASHRLHFIQPGEPSSGVYPNPNWKPDWDAFYLACKDDAPIWAVIEVLWALQNAGFKLMFITGRSEICRRETAVSLYTYTGIIPDNLHMRAMDDYRPDYEIKKEILFQLFPTPEDRSTILGVFEDRDQVVKMYRDLGLRVFQVAEGNF